MHNRSAATAAVRNLLARVVFAVSVAASSATLLAADPPRALPAGKQPQDVRLGELRTLDSYFPFRPVASPEEWAKRKEHLRRQVLVSNGLWPLPTKTPLEASVHGKVEREDFTVEKVIFQSYPGHYVTGSLYRPKGKEGQKLPIVLAPHGHWPNGRFYDAGEQGVRQQIAMGAERFEQSGRFPLQARCAQLARMGCVVFHYDMEGYADSIQFTDEKGVVQHRPGFRESMNTKENWGLFSPQGELRLQNIMGLQTWNSIRALDFVTSLPGVDTSRIAVSGASGGGTQTFMLAAADERVTLSFPVVMVSTAMQGGCTCENAPYLRIGAGNIDLAGVAAPRPLGMVGALDWTQEIQTKGYPALQNLYKMLGLPDDKLFSVAFLHFPHNYNAVSRTQLYNFVNKHFALGLPEPVIERDFKPLTIEELSVWDAQHPKPTGEQVGEAHERKLVRHMTDDSAKQIEALLPKDAATLAEYRRVVGGGFDVLFGERLEDVGAVEYELADKQDKGAYLQMTGLVTRPDTDLAAQAAEAMQGKEGQALADEKKKWQMQTPMLFLHPKSGWNEQVVIWLDETGKAGLLNPDGTPKPAVAKLLEGGFSVLGVDLLQQGEFLADPTKAPIETAFKGYGDQSQPWMKSAYYTYGYNRPLFAQRVRDALTAIKFVQTDKHGAKKVHLVGFGPTVGPVAAAARAQAGRAVEKAAIDTANFRFDSVDRLNHPMFLPGAVKYGDVPALLALGAPGKLWLAGGGSEVPPALASAYTAGGTQERPTMFGGPVDQAATAAVEWIRQ